MGIRLLREPHQSDRYLALPRPSSGHIVRPADAASVQRTLRPSSGRFVRPADTSSVQRTPRSVQRTPRSVERTNSGNRQKKLSTILLNKTSKSEVLFNSPGRPGLLNKTSDFEVLFNRMVLSFFCRLPENVLSFGLFWLLSHVLLNRMVLSFFCRLPEFVLRWTDEVSAGRTQCPLDGRSVRWTDAASAGRTRCPLDGRTRANTSVNFVDVFVVCRNLMTGFTHSKELCEGPCAFNRRCHMEEEKRKKEK